VKPPDESRVIGPWTGSRPASIGALPMPSVVAILRSRRVPLLVLALALALTAVAASLVHLEADKRDATRFRKSVDQIETLLRQRLDTQVALLRGTAGLFAADEVVTPEEFQAFADRLDLRYRYPGVIGVGFAQRLRLDEVEDFTRRRRLDAPDFTVRPPPTDECVAVALVEPRTEHMAPALGFDLMTDPTRRAAMEQARDTAVPVATARALLLTEVDGRRPPGFLIFLPIYRGGTPPATIAERRAALEGYAYLPFRARDFVEDALDGSDLQVAIELYDGAAANEDALMYASPAPPTRAAFEDSRPLQFAAHAWTVRYRSRPELLTGHAAEALTVLGGLAASALLFMTTLAQTRERERAERVAAELRRSEQALKRTDERLRFLAGASAILGSSLDYQKTLTNVATLAVPVLADWAAVDLVDDDGALSRLTVAHADASKIALAHEVHRRWPPRADEAPNTVIAARQPLLVPEITDGMLAGAARDPDQLRIWRELGIGSVVIVPLLARERVLGAITLVQAESKRRFAPEDAAIAEDLARRAAAAIDNARLYQEAERVSAALARHADELSRSNAELEQFAYVASHDLQEPLRMINNYLDLIMRRYADRFAGQAAEYMAFAIDGAKRMQALIKDLLSFSRAGRGEDAPPGEVDAAEVLGGALKNLARSVEESGAEIRCGPLPRVVFDRQQLLQLFQNLVGNALKFRGTAPPRVEIAAARVDGAWEFRVRDNGIGIDPAHAPRVFEVFQRLHTRDQYPGTGIGLAICRKIIERRGGRIWVESLPGKGATFIFTVPDRIDTEKTSSSGRFASGAPPAAGSGHPVAGTQQPAGG
jgi:signal transduction histidine kinase/CHASE1-domain containing sensor protein